VKNKVTASAAVVDTNVVSFFLRSDTRYTLYKPHLDDKELLLSFMSLAELHRWALKRYWKEPRLSKLQQYISTNYAIHYADEELCRRWAAVREECRKKGRAIDTDDAWIAATALMLNLPLITHNYKDFFHIEGLEVVSEEALES
jgi:tRNA(fMet)-specific endonuclease VapC